MKNRNKVQIPKSSPIEGAFTKITIEAWRKRGLQSDIAETVHELQLPKNLTLRWNSSAYREIGIIVKRSSLRCFNTE